MGSCALAGPAIAMAVSFPLSSQPRLLSSLVGSAHKARGESLGASSWDPSCACLLSRESSKEYLP